MIILSDHTTHFASCVSYTKKDSDSIHFVIEMGDQQGLRKRTNTLPRDDDTAASTQAPQTSDKHKASSKAVRRRGGAKTKNAVSNGSMEAGVTTPDVPVTSVWRPCTCCSRLVLACVIMTSLIAFSVFFIFYVNSEVEKFCYENFPAWICDSTGAAHIKCQLKALFMCKYSVEHLQYLYVNTTALTSRCENVIEDVCIYFIAG